MRRVKSRGAKAIASLRWGTTRLTWYRYSLGSLSGPNGALSQFVLVRWKSSPTAIHRRNINLPFRIVMAMSRVSLSAKRPTRLMLHLLQPLALWSVSRACQASPSVQAWTVVPHVNIASVRPGCRVLFVATALARGPTGQRDRGSGADLRQATSWLAPGIDPPTATSGASRRPRGPSARTAGHTVVITDCK